MKIRLDENKNFRLKTYILDKEDNIVGKDEKEFSVAGGSKNPKSIKVF